MAGALDLYFTNSGLYSQSLQARVVHLFPALAQVKKFSQDKLEGMIRTAKDDFVNKNKLQSSNAVDNLTMKQFQTGTLWIESVGADADRIRGMTVDIAFFDEVQDMVIYRW
jgi:phage terminase large subunit GpA-like protein